MPISKHTIITLWEGPENGDAFSLGPFSLLSLALVYSSYLVAMGNSQSQPSKSTPLGYRLWNLKALGFQGEIRPKRLIYYSTLSGNNRDLIIGPNGQKIELLSIILYRTSITSAATTASAQKSLMFRLSSLSTLSLWLLSYFSNTLSPLWATSS